MSSVKDVCMDNENYAAPAIVASFIVIMVLARTVDPTIPVGDIMTAISTLVAAFVGAWAAFSMQDKKKKREGAESNRSAANQAIYLVMMMWNNLRQYRNEVIVPAVKTGVPWLSMKGTVSVQYEVKLPHEGLLFMLDSGHAQLYAELLLEEQRYNLAIVTINRLSQIITEQLQPKMDALGYMPGQAFDPAVVAQQLGPAIAVGVQSLTHDTIILVEENVKSLRKIYEQFRPAMVEHFKGQTVIQVEFQE